MLLHADSKDSDQTAWLDTQADLSLHWMSGYFVGSVVRWLISSMSSRMALELQIKIKNEFL